MLIKLQYRKDAHNHTLTDHITIICLFWSPGELVNQNNAKAYVEDEGSGRKYLKET